VLPDQGVDGRLARRVASAAFADVNAARPGGAKWRIAGSISASYSTTSARRSNAPIDVPHPTRVSSASQDGDGKSQGDAQK
jgi:hypothetical protein